MKLCEYEESGIYRGRILRFDSAKYPFESNVDFMFCSYPSSDSNCSSMALYCITGYNAGQLEYIFPEESILDGNPNCINKEWILNKWTEMVTNCVDINNAEILV